MRAFLEVSAMAVAAMGSVGLRRLTVGPAHPAWSFRVELSVTLGRRLTERSRVAGLGWFRAAQAALPSPLPPALRTLRVEPVMADGVPCQWTWPVHAASGVPERAVVYLHGGGYVSGSPGTHQEIAARLAAGVGVPVLSVDYRLAPEHVFPAAHDDCLRAVRWLRGQGVPAGRTAIAGDSAGGALALATILALRDAGEPQLAGAALLSPWVDPTASGGSMVENERYDLVSRELLLGWARSYASDTEIAAPCITPLSANLVCLPELFIQLGELEVMHDQILAFAERAKAAGTQVTLEAYPGMFHDFQVIASLVSEGLVAVERLVGFLARVLGRA